MSIAPICSIPVWPLVSTLYARRDQLKNVTTTTLPLVTNGGLTPVAHGWKAAQRIIQAVTKALTKGDQEPDILSVDIEAIKAKGFATARQGEPERMRFHLPLVTSPRAFLYYESQAFSPAMGVLTYVPLPNLAANFGDEVRIHLIVDVLPFPPAAAPEAP